MFNACRGCNWVGVSPFNGVHSLIRTLFYTKLFSKLIAQNVVLILFSLQLIQDLNLFWDSKKPELTDCLRYYGLNLVPSMIYAIIFLFDIVLNKSLSKRNRLSDYFKTYYLRCFAQLVLIGSSVFEIVQSFLVFNSANSNQPELFQLVLLTNILKLCTYVSVCAAHCAER